MVKQLIVYGSLIIVGCNRQDTPAQEESFDYSVYSSSNYELGINKAIKDFEIKEDYLMLYESRECNSCQLGLLEDILQSNSFMDNLFIISNDQSVFSDFRAQGYNGMLINKDFFRLNGISTSNALLLKREDGFFRFFDLAN